MDIAKAGKTLRAGNKEQASGYVENKDPQKIYQDGFSKSRKEDSALIDPRKIKVNIFPQDPCIDKKPATLLIEIEKVGKNLDGRRFKAVERKGNQLHSPVINADPEGNLTFDPAHQSENVHVNAFAAAAKTLDLVESNIGHKIRWHSGLEQIPIESLADGRSGYDQHNGKEAIRFGYKRGSAGQEDSYDGFSFDTVAHETAHSISDGLRPYVDRDEENSRFYYYERIKTYPKDNSDEYQAFNEAIADCTSLLSMLQVDENLRGTALETKGDLTRESRLSMFSEHRSGKGKPEVVALRNFINDFTYVPIDDPSLWHPKTPDGLSIIPHSFARIFTGAFYDIFRGIYEKNLERGSGEPDQDAIIRSLQKARDTLAPIFFKSLDFSAPSGINYKSAAQCMLKADALLNDGANKELLQKVFLSRKIFTPEDLKDLAENDRSKPSIRLDKAPATEKEALELLRDNMGGLKEWGLGTVEFNRAESVTDKMGSTFIQYRTVKTVTVDNDLLDYIDDGATLAFDGNGRLISVQRFDFDNPEIVVDKNLVSKELPVPASIPPDGSSSEVIFKNERQVSAESKKIAGLDSYIGRMFLRDNKFIMGGDYRDLTFVNKDTGEVQSFPGIRGEVSARRGGDEIIVIGENITAFDGTTGKILWTADPAGESRYSNAVFDRNGDVYLTSNSKDYKTDRNKFLKLDGKTGGIVWEVDRTGKPPAYHSPPLLSDDGERIFINTARILVVNGYKTPKVIAFAPETGEEEWGFRVKDPIWSKVSNLQFDSKGNIILFCQQGEIYSLKSGNGAMNWSSMVGRGILFFHESAAMPDDKVLLKTDETVYSVDLKTGKEIWSYPLQNITSMTSDKEGNAYAAAGGKLYKFEPAKETVTYADLGYHATELIVDEDGVIYGGNGKDLNRISFKS